MLNLKTPLNLLAGRTQQLLQGLEARLAQGEITSRAGFLTELVAVTHRLLGTLQAPAMETPHLQADDLLIREQVEEPFQQAQQDLQLADLQLGALRELTGRLVNLTQAERAGLVAQLAEVTALTDQFRLWVSDSDDQFLWVGDTFNDQTKVAPSSSAWVDTRGGLVTLPIQSGRSLTPYIVSATLDHEISAGGLPGHNLEVRSPGQEAFTGQRAAPRPLLYGEVEPAPNRLSHLWDGEGTTWFEWERYYVPVPQPTLKAGAAFVYDASGKQNRKIAQLPNWTCYLQWPGEPGLDTGERRKGHPLAYFRETDRQPLRLGIEIVLDRPRPISWVQLTPLIRSGQYPTVDQILVSNDGLQWRPLLTEPTTLHPRMNRGIDFAAQGLGTSNFEGVGVWTLPATPLQYLKVILSQTGSYECPLGIGHRFYRKRHEGGRHRGPLPVVGSPAALPGEGDPPQYADNPAQTARRLREGFDLFRAERQAIGIRDLLLEERLYAESGQLLSQPFTLARPVRAAALLVTEQIPEEWGPGEWLQYEVSPDGFTWSPLIPQRTQLEDSVVRFPTPTKTLWFRATLRRPAGRENETPLLLAYALKLLA